MFFVNRVEIYGSIGEVKHGITQKGDPWANCTINVQKRRRDMLDNYYFRLSAFGDVALTLIDCNKGEMIYMLGELKNNEYEKDGKKISQTLIQANVIIPNPKVPNMEHEF